MLKILEGASPPGYAYVTRMSSEPILFTAF